MHIGFRTSGGRGEYEVVGSHSGRAASQLEGFRFDLSWPSGVIVETGLELEPAESGKPRLRSQRSQPFQIGRLLAALLLLPDPCRELQKTSYGSPVARRKAYILTQMGMGPETEFADAIDLVTVHPTYVEIKNRDTAEVVGVASRCARIRAVHDAAGQFSRPLESAVLRHRDVVARGGPVDITLVGIVREIGQAVARASSTSSPELDPLPELERLAGLTVPDNPDLPPPDELRDSDPLIVARSACEYRLAKSRGQSGRLFAKAVQAAYDYRCAFCGGRFGGIPGITPGVDAAHILAWSRYDLDVVPNGLALCKLHHWAFDAALIVPFRVGDTYLVRFTQLAALYEESTVRLLGHDLQEIDRSWLPEDLSQWPSERYLRKLYADLAIEFASDA